MRPGPPTSTRSRPTGIDELRRLGDLATHQERAGAGHAAFAVLLQGADLAEKLGAPREAADMLARARRPVGGECRPSRHRRTRGPARTRRRRMPLGGARARRLPNALLTRDLVPAERDPLWASSLMPRVARTSLHLGEVAGYPAGDFERAVELSRVDPDSREHAENLVTMPTPYPGWAEGGGAPGDRGRLGCGTSLGLGRRSAAPWRPCLHLVGHRSGAGGPGLAASWEQAVASGEPMPSEMPTCPGST